MELGSCPENCPSIGTQGSCHCFEACFQPCKYFHKAHFDAMIGTFNSGFNLYIRNKHKAGSETKPSAPNSILPRLEKASASACSFEEALKIFCTRALDNGQLKSYLEFLASTNPNLSLIALKSRAELGRLFVGEMAMRPQHIKALKGLLLATEIYKKLEGATIPLSILSKPLYSGLWIPPELGPISTFDAENQKPSQNVPDDDCNSSTSDETYSDTSSIIEALEDKKGLTREQTWSCIAMFEAGMNVAPEGLRHVIAMAWENSIFVTNLLLSDPSDTNSAHSIKRIIGNVGRAGLTMMVAPDKPQIRAPSNCFSLVNHQEYDGKREDNFEKTSLHLSFTQWNVPLVSITNTNERGAIDQDIFFLESVVSVHDQGLWVADLDVLRLLDDNTSTGRSYEIVTKDCECPEDDAGTRKARYTSVDTWNELLDPPESIAVFRARGNWVARLAAVSILMQKAKGRTVVLWESHICWRCFEYWFCFGGQIPEHMVLID